MKILSSFFLFLILLNGTAQGVTVLDEAPSETPTPSVKFKPSNAIAFSDKNTFDFNLNSVFQNDANGFEAFSLFDIHAKSEVSENAVKAEGVIRFKKNFSNSDALNDIELRLAKVTYFENWLQVTAGRMDLSGIISPADFFGSYPTMGIRRLDGISVVLPIRLSFGGEDYKGVNTPPTSISAFYFPTLFSNTYANLNGDQAFLLGQARLRVVTDDIQTTFRFNIGGCATDYFTYSSVCGNTTLSAAIDSKIAKQLMLYSEYGIQNLALAGTSALALGLKVEELGTAGPFSLESLVLEVQEPMIRDGHNAFTGGNTYIPQLAQLPGTTWYAGLKTRIKKVFIQASLTNSVGDYTFARLTPLAVNVPLTVPYGPANEVEALHLPLLSSSYTNIAFMITAGTEF
jgi:hypothetical protein